VTYSVQGKSREYWCEVELGKKPSPRTNLTDAWKSVMVIYTLTCRKCDVRIAKFVAIQESQLGFVVVAETIWG
jgi:hypothetical protein